jgi:hypothetical protein
MNVANASFSQMPVPPAHRHEVAEPHVRELVRDRLGDVELFDVGRERRVQEQQRLAVRHEAGVLHRALREVRDRRLVELPLGIRDRVVLAEPVERVGRDLVRVAARCSRSGRHATRIGVGPANDGSVRPRPPTTTHTRYVDITMDRSNRTRVKPGSGRLASDLGRVRQRRHPVGRDERHLERRLEIRLVPAREVAPRVGRLEVRRDDHVVRPASSVNRERYMPSIRSLSRPVNDRRSV